MKRIAFLLLTGMLGGCLIVTPTPQVPNLEVLSATYATNYRTEDGTSVICDNYPTTLLYRFTYQGELESWTSYLEGQKLKERKGKRTFDPGSSSVTASGEQGFEVQYVMDAYFAPYKQGAAEISPQAIDVVPIPQPNIIGATKLYLILEGADGDARPYSSQDIPVVDICP